MAAPAAGAAAGFGLKSVFDFVVNVKNARALWDLAKNVSDFRGRLSGLGVTIIFVDRLIQSFSRAWSRLNYVIGVSKLSQAANDLRKVSEFTGVGVQKLQAFAIAGESVGFALSDVQDLFQTLDEKVRDMQTEKGIAEDFARYGVGKDFFDGATDSFERFTRLVDHWMKLNPLDRLAFGETILGGDLAKKAGKLGKDGIEGILRLMEEARATGRILNDDQIEVAKRFGDAQRVFLGTIEALQQNFATILMPVLSHSLDMLTWLGQKVLLFLKDASVYIQAFLIRGVDPLLQKARLLITQLNDIKPIGDLILRLMVAIPGVLAAIGLVSNWKLIPFMGAIVASLTAAGVVLDDIATYVRGGKSVFGLLFADAPMVTGSQKVIQDGFKRLREALGLFLSSIEIFVKGPLLPLFIFGIVTTFDMVTHAIKLSSAALNVFVRILSVAADMFMGMTDMLEFGAAFAGNVWHMDPNRNPDMPEGMRRRLELGPIEGLLRAWDPARFGPSAGVSRSWGDDGAGYLGGLGRSSQTINAPTTINVSTPNPEPFVRGRMSLRAATPYLGD